MKIKIKHLLGAGLVLLATLTTTHAAGKGPGGGGGGGGGTPQGTIYYLGPIPGSGTGNILWTAPVSGTIDISLSS